MSIQVFGFVLYLVTIGVYHALRTLLRYSVESEEKNLANGSVKMPGPLAVFLAMEVVVRCLIYAVLPFMFLALGELPTALPDQFKNFLAGAIGSESLVVASLACLGAYWAVFRAWRKHGGGFNFGPVITTSSKTTAQ